jgi:hypothetical protein
MYRFLIAVALVGMLAACTTNQGDGTTGSPSATGSGGAPTGASAACEESFAPIAEMEISSVSDLGDLPQEVQPTVEACESVADWIAGAQQAIGIEVRPGAADFLLRVHCDDPSMGDVPICEELS